MVGKGTIGVAVAGAEVGVCSVITLGEAVLVEVANPGSFVGRMTSRVTSAEPQAAKINPPSRTIKK
jgi:hypothetical protein